MYKGIAARLPLGLGGLNTDDDSTKVPATDLIRANNVVMQYGRIEKEGGSLRWNISALPSPVVAVYDWWPTDVQQRVVALTQDGHVYKFINREESIRLTATPLNAPRTAVFVSGGVEVTGNPRKLFLFTGTNPIQVLSGDAKIIQPIAQPAPEWTANNYPTTGVIHRSRLYAIRGHRVNASSSTNHEDYTTIADIFQFAVNSGVAEEIRSVCEYKGRLFFFKYPKGAYYLEDSDPSISNWYVKQLTTTFGAGAPLCAVESMNQLLIGTETGSVVSLEAVLALGDVKQSDLLMQLKSERFMRTTVKQSEDRMALNVPDIKQALFTYRSKSGTKLDRILRVDYSEQQRPRVTWTNKDNVNCLALMKDTYRVQRPIYGAEDGFIYLMDRSDRDVAGVAYTSEFQTPYLDFSHVDPRLSEQNKVFEFLEVTFDKSGGNLSVEVLVDEKSMETISFSMAPGANVVGDKTAPDAVRDLQVGDQSTPLDTRGRDRVLDLGEPFSLRKPIHGMGRRISFRCYNGGVRENPRVSALTVYFRAAANDQDTE